MRADEDHRGGRRGDDEYGGGGGQEEVADCCSCLPFCGLWGSRKRQRRRRRRRRFRLRFIRLSWFSWPWRKNSGKKKKTTTTEAKGMKRRMLLLLSSSSSSPLPAKKALATSVSAAAAGSLLLPKVSSFAVADGGKKQRSGSKSLPRQTAGGGEAVPAKETAPPARPETTESWQPCPRPAAELAGERRAPSRRHGSFRRDGGGGLWTMATTLGVIVFFGRVTAVAFLCSCPYGARFVRAQASGAVAKSKGGGVNGGGSGRFGERAAEETAAVVEVCTEEHKKKVVMEGLLNRGGKRFSSRFL